MRPWPRSARQRAGKLQGVSKDAPVTALIVSPIIAGLCALLYCGLTGLIVQRRRQTGIDLLDGGDRCLLLRIRAHGNLSETAPIALLLLVVLELQGAQGIVVGGLGAMLLAGRLIHAWAMIWVDSKPARVVGMLLTMASTSIAAVINLWLALSH